MHVTSLSSSVSVFCPTKRKGPRLARRIAAIATVVGASGISATGSGNTVEHARLLSQHRTAAIYDFQDRVHQDNGAPRHVFNTNVLLASSSFAFLCHLAETMSSQDSMLVPVLMGNAPAAVACFTINALAWGALAYRSRFEANEGRRLAVFAASCGAQTAARCVLSLAPIAESWRMVSGFVDEPTVLGLCAQFIAQGGVFGLLGAKLDYDIRHRRLSVLHQSWTTELKCAHPPSGSDLPIISATKYGPISEKLSYADCASHIVCAAAACMMPTHPWCKAAAVFGGALAAYLLGPQCIVRKARSTVTLTDSDLDGESDSESDHDAIEVIHIYDYVQDRPLVPWFAFPTDPLLSTWTSSPEVPQAELSILDLDKIAGCVGKAV